MKAYRQLEHTADLFLEIWGLSWPNLLKNGAYALTDTLTEIDLVRANQSRPLQVTAKQRDELLLQLLKKILLLFEMEQFLVRRLEIQRATETQLQAIAQGEPVDSDRHHLKTEIKAITYHALEVTPHWWGWRARVVLDI